VTTKIFISGDTVSRNPVKVNQRFGRTYRLHLQCRIISKKAARTDLLAVYFVLVSCLAYSSALKVEAIFSSERSFDFYRTTQCYIPEDRILHTNKLDIYLHQNVSSVNILQITRTALLHTKLSLKCTGSNIFTSTEDGKIIKFSTLFY
jgi:hypothetical protein